MTTEDTGLGHGWHYSFDDGRIGKVKQGESVLSEAVIKRPMNLKRDVWYRHAGEVCEVLNTLLRVQRRFAPNG